MADTRVKALQLLHLLCWYSVLGISNYDIIFNVPSDGRKEKTVLVNPGSNVTFVCVIASNLRKLVTLYKLPGTNVVASMSDENTDDCQFYHVRHPRLHKKGCNHTSFSIVLSDVQAKDTGEWYCLGDGARSQTITLEVASTSDSSLAPIIPSTIPSTKQPSTLPQTTPLQSTTTTTSIGVEPEPGDDTSRPVPSNNMIPILGGAIGGGILLMVIITVVVVSLRRRKHSQSGDKRHDDQDRDQNGRPDEQSNDFAAFDDDIGGQYAQIGNTRALTSKGSIPKDKKEMKKTGEDEMVVAENTLYEAYNKEEDDERPGTGASAFDVGPDVYSVVQKPSKSQGQGSNPHWNTKPQPSGSDGPDVYSVVQKPQKPEAQCPDEGVGDVYSVVQKPTNNQTTEEGGSTD